MTAQKMNRRDFLRITALSAGAALLGACQPQGVATPAGQESAPEATSAQPEPQTEGQPAPIAVTDAKEVYCWLGMHQPTEWTSRSAEHPIVVNATRILAQRFEEDNPEIKIVWDEGPGGEEYFPWISAGAAAGTSPDLCWTSHNYAVQNGFAVAIDDYLKSPSPYAPQYATWQDAFWTEYMKSLIQPDGRLYCAPINAIWPNLEVGLSYNADMLDALGLQPPATWSEEMEVAKALKEAGNGLGPWPAEADSGNMWPLALQVLPSMMQPLLPEMDLNGDMFVGIEECLPAFKAGLVGPKTPIYRRAFEEVFKLASYWIEGFNTTDLDLMWREGKLGLVYSGSWDWSQQANDPNITFSRGFLPPPIPDSSDIPAEGDVPGATDPPRTTAGDGTVPGELVRAVQGSETVLMAASSQARNNRAEAILWWQFLTEPENNAFMVNENQQRISSCKDAPLGPIWQEIAQYKLPLYDYSIAWWGQGLYWDNQNFNDWRAICVSYVTGQIDWDTFLDRQQREWEEASARYEEVLKEQED